MYTEVMTFSDATFMAIMINCSCRISYADKFLKFY